MQYPTTLALIYKGGNSGDPSLIVARGLLFARGDLTTKKNFDYTHNNKLNNALKEVLTNGMIYHFVHTLVLTPFESTLTQLDWETVAA